MRALLGLRVDASLACGGSTPESNGSAGSGGAFRDGSAGSTAKGGSGGFGPTDANCCSAEDSNRPVQPDASVDNGTAGRAGASAGGAGAGGASGRAGAGPALDAGPWFGIPCGSDVDCGGGFKCLRPTDDLGPDLGGWPNGICTLRCTAAGNECGALGGVCLLGTQTDGVCTEGCTTGTPVAGTSKCHDRRDEICIIAPVGPLSWCYPLCAGDGDCGSRRCNFASGLCVDNPPTTGAPLGSPCMADSECFGELCIPLAAGTTGVCSALCRLGNIEACGFRIGAIDAGPLIGACLYQAETAGVGDLGACAQLCDTTSDCSLKYPDWTCVQDADAMRLFGHGFCALRPGRDL